MSGHTPGPWWISGEGTIRVGRDGWIAKVMWRNRAANARLIAAAPDMHTLLKRIRKMLSDERRSHPLGLGPDARTGWIDEIDGVIGPETGEGDG